nr:uncharacterized protein LOC129271092 [Lytechinus pictus]
MSKTSIQDVPDLHAAIRNGQFQDIRYMVTTGEDVNIQDPAEHRTPLMLCATIEQEDWGVGIARLLLANGAMVGHSDRRGQNALMTACIYGREELVKVFLKAVDYDPNQRDRYSNTALFYAASKGNEAVVEALIESLLHFRLPLDKPNKWGMTPLLEACRQGHQRVAQMLEDHGASIEVKDSILHWGPTDWRRDHEQRVIEEAPRRRSYDKPWLRNKDAWARKRTVSLSTLRNGSDGLPSISISRASHLMEDDVFLPPAIVVSLTKSEDAISSPRNSLQREKKLPSTSTKRRMLFKPWVQDLSKGQVITATFAPAPATSETLQMHSAPHSSSTTSLSRQRGKNHRNTQSDTGPDYQQSHFKQIFQRYEIQSSDSFRQCAKTPEHMKVPDIQPIIEQMTPRQTHHAHASGKLTRQQSRLNMSGSSRLSSSSSSIDLNAGRKSKAGDLRTRDRGRPFEDSASSVSSEDSSAARMMMNAFRRRKGNSVPPAMGDKQG